MPELTVLCHSSTDSCPVSTKLVCDILSIPSRKRGTVTFHCTVIWKSSAIWRKVPTSTASLCRTQTRSCALEKMTGLSPSDKTDRQNRCPVSESQWQMSRDSCYPTQPLQQTRCICWCAKACISISTGTSVLKVGLKVPLCLTGSCAGTSKNSFLGTQNIKPQLAYQVQDTKVTLSFNWDSISG